MTATEPQTIAAFVAKHGITHTTKSAVKTLADMEDKWKSRAGRFTVTLKLGKKRMAVTYYTGNRTEPELTNVLDCLASDSAGWENAGTFEEWADEYGVDTSDDGKLGAYREAQKTFKAVERAAGRLSTFLGEDVYRELLWETGRE